MQWKYHRYDTKSTGGRFVRREWCYRNWISREGCRDQSGNAASPLCLGATIFTFVCLSSVHPHVEDVRAESAGKCDLSSVSHWRMGQNGWKFEPCVRRDPDPFTVPSISTRSIVPMIRNHRDARRVGPLSAELRHIYRGKKKRSLRGSYCLAKKRQRSLTDDPWPGRTLCESQFNITHLKSLPPQPTVFLLRNSYLESVARVFI